MNSRILENVESSSVVLDRLLEARDGAGAQRVLHAVVIDVAGDDVHRDVARGRMALEVVEHLPAVEHRQAHVEDDRVGLVLVREREARRRRGRRRSP